MARFIKAEAAGHSVIYTGDNGAYFRFSGGTWGWRNHNPGNINPGEISRKNHQIGVAGGFAIFPDYETGHLALLDCLKTTYGNSSIDKLVKGYAPPEDHNNTEKYKKFLHQITGINDNRKVKEFTAAEFEKLWRGIEQMEGSKPGDITEVYKITQAYRNHHGIYEFNVTGVGWSSKEGCISLAKEGKLDVVLCTSHAGNLYLRARPNSSIQNSLETLIVKK